MKLFKRLILWLTAFFPPAGWSTYGPLTSACLQLSVCVLQTSGWLCSNGSNWRPYTLFYWWVSTDFSFNLNILTAPKFWCFLMVSHNSLNLSNQKWTHAGSGLFSPNSHFSLQSLILSTAVPTIIGFSLWREVRFSAFFFQQTFLLQIFKATLWTYYFSSVLQYCPRVLAELSDLQEFYDPDTVELVSWIRWDVWWY